MQVKLTEIKPLHSCFIQLNHIMYRLSWANVFQENLNEELMQTPKTESAEKNWRRIQAQTTMYLDYILLNLDQLLEIHDSQLGKVLKEIGFTELLVCLKNLWNPINDLREKIRLWRNNYVAHGTYQSANFRTLREIDPDYENTIKKTFFASRLASIYIATIFSNLRSDYKLAISLQRMQMSSKGGEWVWENPNQYWKEMQDKEYELTKEIDEILLKHGFTGTSKPDFIGQSPDVF